MQENKIQLTPQQLKKIGVDHESLLGPNVLESFTFGWRPDSGGRRMYFGATFKGEVSDELVEHRLTLLARAFETAVAVAGLLAKVDRTELFPSDVEATLYIDGRKIKLPEDWQRD